MRPKTCTTRVMLAALACGALLASARLAGQATPPATTPNELDAFMAKVLERREQNWRALHDYVLDERERFEAVGPGGIRLHGLQREFTWYVREGFLIRSPLRFEGVAIAETERRQYEARWLKREKEREAKRREKDIEETARPIDVDAFVRQGGEPRFISEAYFLEFKFEPGSYYVAGRETLDGRDVVRIEYYPTRMFRDEDEEKQKKQTGDRDKDRDKEWVLEEKIERSMNKVSLVTLWIDPTQHQIVKFTFENVGFGFLPLRWMMRLDDLRASMTMGQFLGGVWLPREIRMDAGLTLANGTYRFGYARAFADYRQAEVSAKIRRFDPKER